MLGLLSGVKPVSKFQLYVTICVNSMHLGKCFQQSVKMTTQVNSSSPEMDSHILQVGMVYSLQ